LRANKLDLVERLADDLAHEIKNPLHSIVINLEVLRRRVARPEVAAASDSLRYIDVLATELERVSRRVELMLRLLRPVRAGEPVALNDLLEELNELISIEARRRKVSLEYAPGSTPLPARVPREPARQIVLNLVLHVLDALEPGAVLRLSTERGGDCARLVLQGTRLPAGGYPPQTGAPEALSGGLEIAHFLAASIGGSLEHVAAPGEEDGAFVLSLPLLHG
jgi:signal transduction histidine kinase